MIIGERLRELREAKQLSHGDIAPTLRAANGDQWGMSGRAGRYFFALHKALSPMQPDDRKLLLDVAQRMASAVTKNSPW
jgi:hypothetical protein